MHKSYVVFNHFKQHATIYIFMTILFLTGIVFGAVIVNSMDIVQKQDLFFYLERFFIQTTEEGSTLNNRDILWQSFFYHIKYLGLMFIFALSVIGLPIVWILIFIKGMVVGFSVGFIVNWLGMDGLILSAISIAPQNIFIIPIYIIAGSICMIFSLGLLGKLVAKRNNTSLSQPFFKLTTSFVILIVCTGIAAIIEAYISNTIMVEWIQRVYL
ncbi:stage II sporulation protein M [Oceanobacillus kimchii]|uniref:stage II sporulation protein M n=1 Tax=Oceanobacillus kimchii TaxID=746691 RepID=UPI000985464C|nr:stage II sporulation protein M [Oceanobacillus kimchii]